MGGRIAPAIFIDATTNGVFQLRPPADAAASVSSPTSESAADADAPVAAAASRIDSTSIFQLEECLAAVRASEWTATLLGGELLGMSLV